MWNMHVFGIQIEWTMTATRTPFTTRSTRSTRRTTRNPTVCAATWNTWGTREHARSVAVFVVSLCFAVVTLIRCASHSGTRCLRLRLIPSHGHHHVACMSWAFSLTSLTFSSTSLSFSSSLVSSTSSCPSSSLRLSSKYSGALSPRRWGPMTRTSPPQKTYFLKESTNQYGCNCWREKGWRSGSRISHEDHWEVHWWRGWWNDPRNRRWRHAVLWSARRRISAPDCRQNRESQYTWTDHCSLRAWEVEAVWQGHIWMRRSSAFNRCLRQGSVEAPRLWQKMALQILANVEEEWMKKKKRCSYGIEAEGEVRRIRNFLCAYNFWIISNFRKSRSGESGFWCLNQQVCGGQAHTKKRRRIWFWAP